MNAWRATFLTSLVLAAAGAANAAEPIEVGRPFPIIVLPALDDDRPLTIRDFRGEKVILHVFASW